jgi:hypothetical protein
MVSVEWRISEGSDAILVVDPSVKVAEVVTPDAALLKDYLSVAGDLDHWRKWGGWRSVGRDKEDPEAWGELVIVRAANGEVLDVDPELYWEGIRRWFRARRDDEPYRL